MRSETGGRIVRYALAALAAAVVGAQLVPVNRTNPSVEATLVAPEHVLSVLRTSCYDCHSNETTWPWYSRVAPASWLVAKDVREGRDAVNYSEWGRYTDERRSELREETWEDVAEGEMPLRAYTLLHRDARLSAADREVLRAWALAGGNAVEHEAGERH